MTDLRPTGKADCQSVLPRKPRSRASIAILAALAAATAGLVALERGTGQERAEPVAGAQPVAMPADGVARLTETPTHDDSPAADVAADGTVWCAYVSYHTGSPINTADTNAGRFETLRTRGHGDQVRLVSLSNGRWSPPVNVTGTGLDVWRPAVAVDSEGLVWIVWSQQVDGNWDLYARRFNPREQTFGPIRRLTDDAGADIHPVATAVPRRAGAFVAWQARRNGRFDIHLARLDADGLKDEQRISTSEANDWSPAIAASAGGDVWVAWDTYDKGDYDVYARRFSGGRLGPAIPVATSTRFEARPSLIVDRQDRVWIAYEQAGSNWGKDYGTRLVGQGISLYFERHIIVRCLENGVLKQTASAPRSELVNTHFDDKRYKPVFRQRISFPRLALDGAGNVWLSYRRHPTPQLPNGERWVSFARQIDGAGWTEETRLPESENLMDNRPALVPTHGGKLLAVYSTDGRTAGSRTAKINDLRAIALGGGGGGGGEPRPPVLVDAKPEGDEPPENPVDPDEPENVARCREYRIEAGGKTYQLLRGEFHRHTEMSAHRDWDGSMEDMWRYALDVADMDWLGPGDHDYAVGEEYMWWLTQKQVDLYHDAPSFLPMFTYERSMPWPSGHRNVMFAERGIRPLPQLPGQPNRFGTPEGGIPDIKNLHNYLRFFGGICSSHTSATSMGTDWREQADDVEPVVEIFQGHRQNYEEPDALLAPRNPEDSIQGYHLEGFVWEAFKKGHKLGFQSSSDHVSTHISYAFVLAEEPTRPGILDAFRRRHSYAANDNIVLDVRSGEHVMGDEFATGEAPRLEIVAIGTSPIARVDIVRQIEGRDPEYVYAATPGQPEVRLTWTDKAAERGKVNMYYVRIQQDDARMAWGSPMWIRYE